MSNGNDGQVDTGGQFILSPQQLGDKILEWKQQGFHVLSPAIQVSSFAPGYGVNASLVVLDSRVDGDGGGVDVYFDKNNMEGKGDNSDPHEERAPSKIGLMKIAAAAGVSWVEPYGRVDPLTIQNLWIYRVTGVYLAYDGTPQTIKGEKEIDYRDGSAQIGEWSRAEWRMIEEHNSKLAKGEKPTPNINGWSERRVRQARTNGAERAETGALERAIRTLGVAHTYSIAQLKLPFVALRVCPLVDMTDPEVRRQVVIGQLGGVAKLYTHVQPSEPQRAALPPAREPERIVIDSQPVREPVARPASTEGQASPSASRAAAPPPVSSSTAAAPPQQTQKAAPPSVDDPPDDLGDEDDLREPQPPEGCVYIRRVVSEQVPYSASHQKAGQKFTRWTIIDSNGVQYTTIFHRWGQRAEEAQKSGAPVRLTSAEKTFRGNIELEVTNVQEVAGPRLPAMKEAEPQLDGFKL